METREVRESRFQIEKLEERIAPALVVRPAGGFIPPAADAACGAGEVGIDIAQSHGAPIRCS